MPRSRPALLLALAGTLLAAPAAAQAQGADRPSPGALYETGPSGRYLMDGRWLFRLDPTDVGLRQRWQRTAATSGWAPIAVPYAWNAGDDSTASYMGSVGWYRKDFRLPSSRRELAWVVRFESANYRTRAWLNGVALGSNEGAYLPFELRLPASALRRGGVNRLVVRVDSRRTPRDLPPSGFNAKTGQPVGGWWNYGGLLREVYLRRVLHTDFAAVSVSPSLPCATCAASVLVEATVRNVDAHALRVRVAGAYGDQLLDLGTRTLAPGSEAVYRGRVRIARPRLWSPDRPSLYRLRLTAQVGPGAGRSAQTWTALSGIRSIKVAGGRLYLNGRPLNFRGFGLHEDSLDKGSAIDNARRAMIVAAAKDLGATLIRGHYPLHPELLELADREGLMVWSEIPMYQVRNENLALGAVRAKGLSMLERNIVANGTHPSVIVWSIANELNPKPGYSQSRYIADAVRLAHRLDPTRPVGLAVAVNGTAGCQAGFAPLDVIGINEYFNWYPGPDGASADATLLSGALDRVRACYPGKALIVTETGAEANREGPAEERGTYAYQQDFVRWQFATFDSKSWLSGAVYWALQEFRVRPGWDGGNPRPTPPLHQKGLLTMSWERKPAYYDVQRIFRATRQIGRRR